MKQGRGKIKFFLKDRGFGYIGVGPWFRRRDDLYFHVTDVVGRPVPPEGADWLGPIAINVTPLAPETPKPTYDDYHPALHNSYASELPTN